MGGAFKVRKSTLRMSAVAGAGRSTATVVEHPAPSMTRHALVLAGLLLAAFLMAVIAAPASAKPIHKLDSSFDGADTPAGAFAGPGVMDVHQSDQLLYVLDGDSLLKYDISDPADPQLEDFSALGSPAITEAGDPPAPLSLGANADIAVDDSGGPADGTIYVSTGASGFVADGHTYVYSATGEYLRELKFKNNALTATPNGLDVVAAGDRAGDLYVARVTAFGDNDDNFLHYAVQGDGTLALDAESGLRLAQLNGVALTADGETFFTVTNSGVVAHAIDGTELFDLDRPTGFGARAAALAVDPASGDVYTAGQPGFFGAPSPTSIDKYAGADSEQPGAKLDEFGADTLAIGIDSASDTIYGADGVAHEIDVYGPGTVPDLTIGDAEFEALDSAALSGTVNPLGDPVSSCEFEYGTTTNYGQSAACDPANLGSGTEPVDVSGIATGLTGGTQYHYRLKVTNADGTNVTADKTYFAPNLPEATTSERGPVGSRTGSALLGGTVDANKTPTKWWIEYGTEADLSDAQSSPANENLDAGDGTDPIDVTHTVQGLQPETTYYYRVVAATAAGSAEGDIRSFFMPAAPAPDPDECPNAEFRRGGTPSAGLPDCRAYERVSPADKNGGSVVTGYDITTSDGNRVTYGAETAFAGQQSLGITGAYRAERGPDGWTSEGLQPPVRWTGIGTGLGGWLPRAVDADLEDFFVTGQNIALPGIDGDALVHRSSDGEWNVLAGKNAKFDATATRDGWIGITLGEPIDVTDGPDGLPGTQGVYEIAEDGSAAHLISVDENGAPIDDTSTNLQGVAADGTRVFFQTSSFSPSQRARLWVRIDNEETKELTHSEVNPGQPPRTANFAGATPDGEHAFFISGDDLTSDSPAGAQADLFRYDVETGDLTNLTTTDPNGGIVRGVLGFSDDGEVVYFESQGNLTPDATGTGPKIYRADDDGLTLITDELADPIPGDTYLGPNVRYAVGDQKQAEVSPDGRYVMFATASDFGVFKTDGFREYWRYDAVEDRFQCVSCSVDGLPPTGHAFLAQPALYRASPGASAMFGPRPRLMADGSVIFATPDALVPQDTNNDYDVYMWDGEARLISAGTSVSGAWPVATTEDGSSIFFISRGRLVGADTDDQVDLYVARVDGGLESQQYAPVEEPPCQGPACRDDEQPPPETDTPGTEQGGSQGTARRCKAAKRKLNRAERRADRVQSKAQRKQRQVRKLRRKAKRANGKRAQKLHRRTKAARRQTRKLDRRAAKAAQRSERAARRASRCVNGGAK